MMTRVTAADMPAPDPDPALIDTIYNAFKNGRPDIIRDLRQQVIDLGDRAKLDRFDQLVDRAHTKWQNDNEAPEAERVKAARLRSKNENDRSPSSEDVARLYEAPKIETTLSPDGSFVENVHISRWVVDPDTGIPHQVQMTDLRDPNAPR